MNQNIYKGANPVFESMLKTSKLYEKDTKVDPAVNLTASLSTLFTMVLDSKE